MIFPYGMIIVFEGLDCSFKETNHKEFINRLKKANPDRSNIIISESFPRYGTDCCAPIEKWLNGSISRTACYENPGAINNMYCIDRFNYWNESIFDIIDNGYTRKDIYNSNNCVFVFDRYNVCNQLYNPTVKNRNLTVADFTAENSVYGNPEPDIVIWLRMKDFDILEDLLSKKKGRDINELDLEYLHKVWDRSEYCIKEGILRSSYKEFIVIDLIDIYGELKTKERIADEIWEKVNNSITKLSSEKYSEWNGK